MHWSIPLVIQWIRAFVVLVLISATGESVKESKSVWIDKPTTEKPTYHNQISSIWSGPKHQCVAHFHMQLDIRKGSQNGLLGCHWPQRRYQLLHTPLSKILGFKLSPPRTFCWRDHSICNFIELNFSRMSRKKACTRAVLFLGGFLWAIITLANSTQRWNHLHWWHHCYHCHHERLLVHWDRECGLRNIYLTMTVLAWIMRTLGILEAARYIHILHCFIYMLNTC